MKGYLRCGKILRLQNQNSLALKIYERGLKKVKIGTDNNRIVRHLMMENPSFLADHKRSYNPCSTI